MLYTLPSLIRSVSLLQEFHNVDANFVKLFRLAQLIIEYLLVSLYML